MTKALRTAQGRSNFARQMRAQLRAHKTPHIYRSPLGGHRNQGLFIGAGFYTNPFAPKFCTLQLASILQLDDQTCTIQRNTFAVCSMARINQECSPYCHQLQPSKSKDKPGALNPKNKPMPSETAHNEAYIQPNCAGVTEQLRLKNQWMPWPETVAKRKIGFDTVEILQCWTQQQATASRPCAKLYLNALNLLL